MELQGMVSHSRGHSELLAGGAGLVSLSLAELPSLKLFHRKGSRPHLEVKVDSKVLFSNWLLVIPCSFPFTICPPWLRIVWCTSKQW